MPEINHFEAHLFAELSLRKSQDLYRSLALIDNKVDFSSNDYLGLVKNNVLQLPLEQTAKSGATGSRLISGNSIEAELAESTVANYHGAEAALIFNSGYMANVGLLSAIAHKGDTIILDEYAHASLLDGARLSYANRFKFKHNDLSDLEQKLSKATGHKFVVVESIYSMDGDEAPLIQIADLCERHAALLIVDEAHATGVWGENGRGLVHQYELHKKVFATVYTFGKALGLHGAAVVGSETLKHYLINFARPFIYSTALAPHLYQQIHKVYQILENVSRKELLEIIQYFKQGIQTIADYQFIDSNSQIQAILIGDNTKAKALSSYLFDRGIYAKAILSPTVPKGTERIRICLHSFNTREEIDVLIQSIQAFTT